MDAERFAMMHRDAFAEPVAHPRAASIRRPKRHILLVALGLLVSLVLLMPGSVQAQGNSENAKACLHGGWQHLQTTDGKPFANQQECVTAGAQGAVLEPIPTGPITITFTKAPNTGSCRATVRLAGFALNTTYTLTLAAGEAAAGTGTLSEEVSITTDSSGRASYTFSFDIPAGYWAIAEADDINSGWIYVTC